MPFSTMSREPAPASCELARATGTPGYPLDLAGYQQDIWPLTQGACSLAGCHCLATGARFRVGLDDGDPCSVIRSFNQFCAASELDNVPEQSDAYGDEGD